MTANAAIRDRIERSFQLYRDLAASLDEGSLAEDLPGLPSNTIGQQLWCVIGARESYARAIEAGQWSGFACTLNTTTDLEQVASALRHSEDRLRVVLTGLDSLNEAQQGLLLDLLEHEAQHQGQLIRYLYGLRLPIPESWQERYALTPLA